MEKIRILAVDDDPNLSRLVAEMLHRAGAYEVRTESRPFNAIAAMHEFNPAAVVLDVEMPGKNGGDIAREMQNDPDLRDLPIVFLTSLISHAESGTRLMFNTEVTYLAKPPKPMELIEALDEALGRRSSA